MKLDDEMSIMKLVDDMLFMKLVDDILLIMNYWKQFTVNNT